MKARTVQCATMGASLISILSCAPQAHRRLPSEEATSPSATTRASRDKWVAGEVAVCGEIRGRVVDRQTARPIKGAAVSNDGAYEGATSDTAGIFRFRPTGSGLRILRVRAIGYDRLEFVSRVDSATGTLVEIRLASASLHADGIAEIALGRASRCRAAT
jgi:hypothetical protein